jgi:hypothetical protein
MELSIFLAKLLGLYFLVCAVLCLFRKKQIEAAAKDMASSKGTLAVSAEISLIFGLAIVIDHSIWEYSWRGLITLIGYLMILKAVLRFAFPSTVKKMVSKCMGSAYWLTLIVLFLIGIYLTYCGFAFSAQSY